MAYLDKVSLGGTLYDVTDTKGRAMIAPKEETSTASAAHATGTYFTFNDLLYRATADIAAGGTITPNTNCVAVTVGAETSELKSAIDEITETTGYQYVQVSNVTKYPDERWYINGTGPTSSGASGKTALEFPCKPLTDYDICGKYAGADEGYPIIIMDASYTVLQTITNAVQVTIDGEDRHTLFTTPASAAIVRYNVATDANFDSQREKVAAIEPKGISDLQTAVTELDGRCDALENEVDDVKDAVDGITENEILGYTQIANVTKYPDERWYLNGTGPTSSGATGKTALEFACQPNTAYAICGKYAGTAEGYPIIIMDSSDTVLDTITNAEQTEYQGVNRFTFFTTHANAAKVRYNVATDASFDQQLEAVYYLAPKGFSTLTPNILAGKKWAALGDSFTAYTNKTFDAGVYKTQDRVYSRLIAERNRMTLLDKFFASGRTLAYPSDGTFTNSVTCPTAACYYQNIPADVDYITIMLGINDEHHYTGGGDGEDPTGVITLGTIDDNTTATYYGAWNVVLSWLIANRPNAHIGIIVTNGLSIPEWRQAQINIAQKYGVAYIDLNGDQITPVMLRTVNSNIADSVKAALISKWAVDPTGAGGTVNTHPNWQAHEYEAAFVEDFLRRI